MGLGSRKASRHETAASERTAGVRSEDYWAFQPGSSVMTVDGILGTVTAVQDGPHAGSEAYEVTLAKGMGGGVYTASQLSPAASTTASTEKTAAEDYPELGTVLNDRPDPAINTVLASRTAASAYELHNNGDCYPPSCPVCAAEDDEDERDRQDGLLDRHEGSRVAVNDAEMSQYSSEVAGGRQADMDAEPREPNSWCGQCSHEYHSGDHPDACPSCGAKDHQHDIEPPDDQDDYYDQPDRYEPDTLRPQSSLSGPPPFPKTAEGLDEEDECEHCGSTDHATEDHEDEPDEEDAYVSGDNRGSDSYGRALPFRAQHGGKSLGSFPTEGLAHHAIEHENQKSGYYPNVWTDEGRGMRQSHGDYAHEHAKYFKDGPTSPGVEYNPHPDEHRPIDEYSSREDVEKHLMDHHGWSKSDLMTPGESSDSWRHHLIDQVGGAQPRERVKPKPEDLSMLLGGHDSQHEVERCSEPGCEYTSAGHEHGERDLGGLEDSVNHAFGDDTKQMWGDHLLSGNEIGPTKYSSKTADHGYHEDLQVGPSSDDPDDDYVSSHGHDTWRGEQFAFEPGLGCPHCKEGFMTEDSRTRHIREQHPGEYSGPTDDLMMAKDRINEIRGQGSKTAGYGPCNCGSPDHSGDEHYDWAQARHAEGTHDAWGRPLMKAFDGHGAWDCNNYDCAEHPSSMYEQKPGEMPGWLANDIASPEEKGLRKQVNDATSGSEWLLDQQHQGPSKYSSKTAAVPNEERDGDDLTGSCKAGEHENCEDYADTNCLCQCHDHWGVPQKYNTGWQDDQYSAPLFTSTEPHPSHQASLDPYSIVREAASDGEFRFEVTASWSDVRNKAKRIRSEGGVRIVAAGSQGVQAEVKGDHHIYETGLQYMAGSRKIAIWQCGCKWAAYAWGRSPRYKRFEGRMCSHALAVQFEAASRGMFGKEVREGDGLLPGQKKRTPVVIQFDKADDKNRTRRTVPPGNMRTVWSKRVEDPLILTTVAQMATSGDDPDEIGLLLTASLIESDGLVRFAKQAAVNDAWGEPAPPQQTWPTLPGATQQKDPQENPASAGFAAGPDPIGWQTISPLTMGDRVASAVGPHQSGDIYAVKVKDRQYTWGCKHCGDLGTVKTQTEALNRASDHLKSKKTEERESQHEASHYSEEAEEGDTDVCSNCGTAVRRTTMDSGVPWVHYRSGNAKCDVDSTADAVMLKGIDSGEAAPTMHSASQNDEDTSLWDSNDQNEYGVQADLHDEPEPALPSTDGSTESLLGNQQDQMHAVYDDALSPEDSSIQTVGGARSSEEESPGVAAIVAEFQRTAGAAVIMKGGDSRGEAGPSDMDIAAAARAHLEGKTAMRAFSPSEQQQLINEKGKARNTDMLDIGDTHYARLDELRGEDDDEDWMG